MILPPEGARLASAYLQREGERQVGLHTSTGGQHNLMGPQNPLGALGRANGKGGGVRSLQLKYVSILKTPGIYLDLHSNDHRDQLFIQLPQHNQLLQRQTAQPADRRTDGQMRSPWVEYEQACARFQKAADSHSKWKIVSFFFFK